MNHVFGIFAHVDAGKTSFSEQLLYQTKAVRSLGRVDDRTSLLDGDELERQRGITIYAGSAALPGKTDCCYLMDTPGHTDFSGEAERVMEVLDCGLLLIGGMDGVRAHTKTMFRLLRAHGLPVWFFINKADQAGFALPEILTQLRETFSEDLLVLSGEENDEEAIAEFLAEREETFLEAWISGSYSKKQLADGIRALWRKGLCFPVMTGSAMTGEGIKAFWNRFLEFLEAEEGQKEGSGQEEPGRKEGQTETPCRFQIYQVRHDEKGRRLVLGRVLQGTLEPKDTFLLEKDGEIITEKVSELRRYHGSRFETIAGAKTGELAAALGLNLPGCGCILEEGKLCRSQNRGYSLPPALCAGAVLSEGTDPIQAGRIFHLLEEEDPQLNVTYEEETGEFLFHVMGPMQLEILKAQCKKRFGLEVSFGEMKVQYRETIQAPVTGWGHFEPLRHYAEVQLLLEPGPRGSGITFESRCSLEVLSAPYQSQVREWVESLPHKGVLTGSLLTDVKMTLLGGRSHLKHTEGGDFREAVRRAVRQGLMKADSLLLEPFYRFELELPVPVAGRAMTDIRKMRGIMEESGQAGALAWIRGRGPVETFSVYQKEFMAYTRGEGSLSLVFDGYDRAEEAERILKERGYDPAADPANPASSVFCKKGAGFSVPWDEAESWMHTKG